MSTRPMWVWTGLLLGTIAFGCAGGNWVRVRSVPDNPLADRLRLMSRWGPEPTARTRQYLRRYNLEAAYEQDPGQVLGELQAILGREPLLETLHAIAEVAYLTGCRIEKRQPGRALDLFLASTAHSYLYLFDERFADQRNKYDPQYRGACDLYNSSLEGALRIIRGRSDLQPGHSYTVETHSQRLHVHVVSTCGQWRPEDFDRFEFVSDFDLKGLTNRYHTYGLGVPLIVVPDAVKSGESREGFLPAGLCFPVTAFLRLVPCEPGAEACADRHAVLEFHDPLDHSRAAVGADSVPLETDLTTPLAYSLDKPSLQALDLATLGLLDPSDEKIERRQGLYMLEPYQPGKIPVVMIHGLWSSPITWMEMFNDLRGDPWIRANYQFWFYLYPTGHPFLRSATQFRQELERMRMTVDPMRVDGALDHMVLVGHSMGGLVAKLQTVESGNDFWKIVSDRPFQEVFEDSPASAALAANFFFQPNPSVRRVITIGTPFGGSGFSNRLTRYLSHKIIAPPRMAAMLRPDRMLGRPAPLKIDLTNMPTSIDSLSPQSPILASLKQARVSPYVVFHNVIGDIPRHGLLGRVAAGSDGVVSVESAKNPDAVTELVVPADHVNIHRQPRVIFEVREILRGQLLELAAWQQTGQPPTPTRPGPYRTADEFIPPPRPSFPELPAPTAALP
jgi:pimeloyl-ACP methyl ester carboxylesterase